jgi:two-component system sensor histidine kinase BaeS
VIRSLRARLFLTIWPLLLAAIVAVALLSTRSAHVELAQFETRVQSPVDAPPRQAIASAVEREWSALHGESGRARLRAIASALRDSAPLIVLDTAGRLVAASVADVAAADVRLMPDGNLELSRTARIDGEPRLLQRLFLSGVPLRTTNGERLGFLFVLPSRTPTPSGAQRMVNGIQRTTWLAVIIASALSAIAAWWLAFPLVAQVQRLTRAAGAVSANALDTRVTISSADELGALEHSFNAMAESLAQTERTKRQMISDLAHELRTPLTNVIGLLEAMRDGMRPTDAATLQSTQDEALLLKRLIDELQELSLADAGALRFDCAATDIRSIVQQAADAFQGGSPAPRATVPTAPVIARVDAQRVAQVLRNVLQNAVTHTPPSGAVKIALVVDGQAATIRVTDTGRGIPADQLAHIFDRFYRVDPSRDRTTGGMGLGLALAKRMVERMEGTIRAESETGQGTCITIRFPLAAPTTP